MAEPFVDPNDDTNLYWLMAHQDDVQRAECSPDDAAKVLSIAAGYLRKGEVVPAPLALFIADAFDAAVDTKESEGVNVVTARVKTLARKLNLSASNRRPKVSENEMGCWIFRRLAENPGKALTAVLIEAAKAHGIGKTTASDHWEKWKPKHKAAIEVLKRIHPKI